MFCHGDDNILPTSDVLNPKLDDCFTSSTDYVLHSSTLDIKVDLHDILCHYVHTHVGVSYFNFLFYYVMLYPKCKIIPGHVSG